MSSHVETDVTGMPVQLDGLDDEFLLCLAEDAETQARVAERRRARYVAQWCLRRQMSATDVAALPADRARLDSGEIVGGDGCPVLEPFSAEPLAVAFAMSTGACLQLMHDVWDLVHRLPRTWARVESLEVPLWRARRVAQASHALNAAAAHAVDAAVAGLAHRLGPTLLDRAVAAAAARHDPHAQAEREAAAAQTWDVTTGTVVGPGGEVDGTSWLTATGDTDDLDRFYALVGDLAAQASRDGDTADLGVRRARALGRIADLLGDTVPSRPRRRAARLYLHVSTDGHGEPEPIATVERHGALTLARLGDWLTGCTVRVTPVVDTRATSTSHPHLFTDAHDPGEVLRETVVLRDRTCVFPHCTVDARDCDLDHVEPFVPLTDGGPPGQTRPENLAPLCRRHHRLKTARAWTYRRDRDGTYTWTDPNRVHHRVDPRRPPLGPG